MFRKIVIKLFKFFYNVCPKSKKIWVFGAWGGRLYADNSKYFFEYVNTHHPEIKAVWFSQNPEVVKQLRKEGKRACRWASLRGLWYISRAKIAVETEGEWDISPILSYKKTQVIQLWHGMGAKAMRWKRADGEILMGKSDFERFNSYYWMSCSELCSKTMANLLQVDPSRFVLTGYPRNDQLVAKPKNEYMEQLRAAHPDSKFVVYMPTHRNFGKNDYMAHNIDDLKHVDTRLREANVYMVYKPHVHELKNVLAYESEFTNLLFAKDETIWSDVYSYLHYFDALISDYSSISTDFMCLGRPIVLFAYDLENYKTGDAGLNDFFYELPGGPICQTWDETLDKTFAQLEDDTWKEKREKCREQYHCFNDGKNCERVWNAVNSILNNKTKR